MSPSPTTEAHIAETLRVALRGLAMGVVVLAARDGADRHAMTATAVTPLSFAPPAMLACVNETASIHPALKRGAEFSINILSVVHEPLARLCSSSAQKGEARFGDERWRADERGVPFLHDAVAVFCTVDVAHMYGTHGVFIGRVRTVRGPHVAEPLLYYGGRYASLGPQPDRADP
ncbi:MAG: flavin reductase family protein [Hyphomonadaceae bacterium]|nr:flavin reductase family protein [Hyphomonadaceae bacterium]